MTVEECSGLFAQNFSFWEHLADEEKRLLCRNTVLAHYPKGTAIHNGNQDCIGILLVKSGQLRTYLLSEDGREVTLTVGTSGAEVILSSLNYVAGGNSIVNSLTITYPAS